MVEEEVKSIKELLRPLMGKEIANRNRFGDTPVMTKEAERADELDWKAEKRRLRKEIKERKETPGEDEDEYQLMEALAQAEVARFKKEKEEEERRKMEKEGGKKIEVKKEEREEREERDEREEREEGEKEKQGEGKEKKRVEVKKEKIEAK